MEEVWKDIPDYEGYYQVSNLGRVRSLDLNIIKSNGMKYSYKGRIIKFKENRSDKRPEVQLYKDTTHKMKFVCHLVLEAFVGPKPLNKECCHRNDIPTDNNLDNLYWGTREENIQDKIRNGKTTRGEKSYNHKLTESDVKDILLLLEDPSNTQQSIANKYGVVREVIKDINIGKIWKHVTGRSWIKKPDKVTIELIENIKNFILENPSLSQREVGIVFGIDGSTVSRILNNKHKLLRSV